MSSAIVFISALFFLHPRFWIYSTCQNLWCFCTFLYNQILIICNPQSFGDVIPSYLLLWIRAQYSYPSISQSCFLITSLRFSVVWTARSKRKYAPVSLRLRLCKFSRQLCVDNLCRFSQSVDMTASSVENDLIPMVLAMDIGLKYCFLSSHSV